MIQLQDFFDEDFSGGEFGVTRYSGVLHDTIQAGGATREVIRFTGQGATANIMAVFTGNNRFATMTTLHELGHALGYLGHSPNPNDVMRDGVPSAPIESLRPSEIEHLRQINRRFRLLPQIIELPLLY